MDSGINDDLDSGINYDLDSGINDENDYYNEENSEEVEKMTANGQGGPAHDESDGDEHDRRWTSLLNKRKLLASDQ